MRTTQDTNDLNHPHQTILMNPEQAERTKATIKTLRYHYIEIELCPNFKDKNVIMNSYDIIIAELEKLVYFYKRGTFV